MRTLTVVLLIFAGHQLGAQSLLTPAQQKEDYDILQKALQEAHGGLYRHVGSSAIDLLFKIYRETLTKPATHREFISVLSEILGEIHDGHTRLEYDQTTTTQIAEAKMFPLQVKIDVDHVAGRRVFVVFNDSPVDRKVLPGAELLAVNSIPLRNLLSTIVPKTPGDGNIITGKYGRIERSFPLLYWLFIDPTERFEVTVRNPDQEEITVELDGILSKDRQAHRVANPVNAAAIKKVVLPNSVGDNISLKFNDGVAVLSIRSFADDSFKSTLDTSFLAIRNKKAKSVILDLRNNGGGTDSNGAYLVSQFTDIPFRYFDRIELTTINPSFTTFTNSTYDQLKTGTKYTGGDAPLFRNKYQVLPVLHDGVAGQQPSQNSFDGKLVVLINGNTFSTAADVAAVLHNMKRATFVGEETGGGYEGNTSGLNAKIVLPHSGLSLKVQMYDYYNAVKRPAEPGRGTMPDHPIKNSIKDLLDGFDSEMQVAMNLAIGN